MFLSEQPCGAGCSADACCRQTRLAKAAITCCTHPGLFAFVRTELQYHDWTRELPRTCFCCLGQTHPRCSQKGGRKGGYRRHEVRTRIPHGASIAVTSLADEPAKARRKRNTTASISNRAASYAEGDSPARGITRCCTGRKQHREQPLACKDKKKRKRTQTKNQTVNTSQPTLHARRNEIRLSRT